VWLKVNEEWFESERERVTYISAQVNQAMLADPLCRLEATAPRAVDLSDAARPRDRRGGQANRRQISEGSLVGVKKFQQIFAEVGWHFGFGRHI